MDDLFSLDNVDYTTGDGTLWDYNSLPNNYVEQSSGGMSDYWTNQTVDSTATSPAAQGSGSDTWAAANGFINNVFGTIGNLIRNVNNTQNQIGGSAPSSTGAVTVTAPANPLSNNDALMQTLLLGGLSYALFKL